MTNRKLINITAREFVDFMELQIFVEVIPKQYLFKLFLASWPDFIGFMDMHTFGKWIGEYCRLKGLELGKTQRCGYEVLLIKNYKMLHPEIYAGIMPDAQQRYRKTERSVQWRKRQPKGREAKLSLKVSKLETAINVMSKETGVPIDILVPKTGGKKGTQKDGEKRFMLYLIARQLGLGTLKGIGSYFGGRDHTTIVHGIERAKELLVIDKEYSNLYSTILTYIGTTS